MKILVRNNEMFGKFRGNLINDNLTAIELPSPLNVSATEYTGTKENIIEKCKRDAKIIFDIDNLEVIDITS